MNSKIAYCIVFTAFIFTACLCQAFARMSMEAWARINAEIEAIQRAVEKQDAPGEKHATLRAAFAKGKIPYVKKHILEMAVAIGGPELEPFLLSVLRDEPHAGLRIVAVRALGEHGSTNAVQPLLNTAENDPESKAGWLILLYRTTARRDAYFALAEIGLRHPDARKSITTAITALPVPADDFHDVKAQALYILTQNKELLKAFFERLQHEDPKIRVRGVVAFRLLRLTQAPKELVELLDDPHRDVRSWVALVLGEIGDPVTIPALIATAKDKNENRGIRLNAIGSLGRMRAKSAAAVMEQLLDDENVKVGAAIALSRITGERHPLVPEGRRLD